ncbi:MULTISPECIES: DUF2933 domain-containing protein [Vogesella]|uniref:DUF2933 family protein n=1 Tax=Vogesella indigofera TaxID=45465 RepID=A0A495BKP7_VOGIN|nr:MULTISPECIES: DUF2933 domain-containing protein [Vogesella]MCQ4143421.1 DUF2933 domain-containing protein [Vogesella sp. AC12]OHC61471.1 MAG: hypothetical protein A2045_05320 [Rhodocyclales bacterium GWA2_65_20]RKQ61471.1 hypothetical protein C8E02_1246 [Vogesella indigofera]
MPEHHDPHSKRSHWVFIGFVLVAGFLLFTEHRAHVLGALPYLLLLACPLMHLFMHHGHGHHHGGAPRHHHQDKDGEQP